MNIKKITPILVVEAIEPGLSFWQNQLGFAKVVEVPHEGSLGFAIFSRQGAGEVMLQTRASLAVDLPAIAARKPTAFLYVDVASLQVALDETRGAEVIVTERTTFYGAHEAAVVDPCGQIIVFSMHER